MQVGGRGVQAAVGRMSSLLGCSYRPGSAQHILGFPTNNPPACRRCWPSTSARCLAWRAGALCPSLTCWASPCPTSWGAQTSLRCCARRACPAAGRWVQAVVWVGVLLLDGHGAAGGEDNCSHSCSLLCYLISSGVSPSSPCASSCVLCFCCCPPAGAEGGGGQAVGPCHRLCTPHLCRRPHRHIQPRCAAPPGVAAALRSPACSACLVWPACN